MARFRAENLILQEDQKVRLGVDYSNVSLSELWWDTSAPHPTTSGDLRLSSTISGVNPIYDYHLTTKWYVDDEIATLSGSIILDHGNLTGLLDDDHPQYVPTNASRGFTATVSGIDPTLDYHLATKAYVDTLSGTGEVNTASNLGGGTGIYAQKVGADLQFKSLVGAGTVGLSSDSTTITISGSGVTDHGLLTGLDDDDHTQYILVDGTRGFTGTVSGVAPTDANHLTTKQYVDDSVYGLDWKDSVLTFAPIASGVQSTGNRYIASATGGGWTKDQIYEWDGSQWVNDPVDEGAAAWVEDEDGVYTFNGTAWVKFGNTVTHNNLSGLQGGTSDEYYHLTSTMYSDLTSFGGVADASSQHTHDDRYFTESEITTISGDILTYVSDNYIDNTEMTTISGDILTYVSDNYIDNTEMTTISGDIINYVDNVDHTMYSLVDGTRAFTGTVSGVAPTEDAHLTTKAYVDDTVSSGIDRHGRTSLAYKASQVTVNFTDLGHTNYTVNATLENTTDSPPSIYVLIVSAKNSGSFVADFSGKMDSANYLLNWMIAED